AHMVRVAVAMTIATDLAVARRVDDSRDRRHREVAGRGAPCQQVAEADPPVGEQPLPAGHPAFDLGGVAGVIRHEEAALLLLEPTEPPDSLVSAMGDAGLAA